MQLQERVSQLSQSVQATTKQLTHQRLLASRLLWKHLRASRFKNVPPMDRHLVRRCRLHWCCVAPPVHVVGLRQGRSLSCGYVCEQTRKEGSSRSAPKPLATLAPPYPS